MIELMRFLNIRLDGIKVEDPERHPHMVCSCKDPADPSSPLRTASFEGRWCGMSVCRLGMWTRRCWKMQREGVSKPLGVADEQRPKRARSSVCLYTCILRPYSPPIPPDLTILAYESETLESKGKETGRPGNSVRQPIIQGITELPLAKTNLSLAHISDSRDWDLAFQGLYKLG